VEVRAAFLRLGRVLLEFDSQSRFVARIDFAVNEIVSACLSLFSIF
jgi:hypothetical protein